MKNWIIRSLLIVFVIMLLLIVQYGYRGTPLEFDELSFSKEDFDSVSSELIFMSLSEEQITTYDEYLEFKENSPVELITELNAEYFLTNTIAVLIYEEPNKQITHFYDYAFMLNDTEIINYRTKSNDHDDIYLYLIYASRGAFESEYILFDRVK